MTAVLHRAIAPERLGIRPIDEQACSGRYQLIFGEGQYAVARWTGEGWAFSSGRQLDFEPAGYRP